MITALRAQPFYPAELPLAELKASRAELEEHLGSPHRFSDAADDEPGPCAYWAYQFPCGLVAFIKLHVGKDQTELYAGAPEFDHLLRHLELPERLRERVKKCTPQFPRRRPTASLLWNLWREDMNGNRFLIGSHPTLRSADCLRLHLEASAHKQVYWVEQEGVGRKDFKLCPQCLRDYQLLTHKPGVRMVLSFIPFACIVWDDEHPGHSRLCCGHPDCAISILKLSAARLALWKMGAVPEEYTAVWEQAKESIPNWPGFKRMTIGPNEWDCLKAIEEQNAGVTGMFRDEGWNVEHHVNQHGLRSFQARKTWLGMLRQRFGFSAFQSRQSQLLRRWITFGFACSAAFAIAGGIAMTRLYPSRKWPVLSGEVVDVRPGPWFILHRRTDVRIRLRDGSEVHAIIAPYLTKQLPREVQFHYSGDPNREVFLHELENNPDWFLYAGLPMTAFLAWCLFFADLEKASRRDTGARQV